MPALQPTPPGPDVSQTLSAGRAKLAELFGIDLRSLAAFRIATGLLLLADLALRARDLSAFYTDDGVLPRVARIELYELGDTFGRTAMWSFHLASGQAWFQGVLMLIAAAASLAMLLGYRTRLSAVIAWLLLLSLDSRNPMILNSGDVLLRSMLLWSLFLPLGSCCSIDALRQPLSAGPTRMRCVVSMASAALLLQLAMMYFFSALFKNHPAWTSQASGVYYALNCDAYATSLGVSLRQFPLLMRLATWATFAVELLGPVLVFVPWQTARIRLAAIVVFWLFHTGLALTLTVGLFAPICMVAWLVYLPPVFWNRAIPWWNASAYSRPFRELGLALRRLVVPGPSPRPSVHSPLLRRVATVGLHLCLAALLLYCVVWNIRELDVAYWEKRILPRELNGVARALGLDQNWSMFSPIPRTEDGWLVMRGVLRSGEEVNLWDPGQPLPWDKPRHVSASYKRQRWRKYLDNLSTDTDAVHRLYFANWLQSEWNRRHAGQDPQREVVEVQLIHRIELTPPPGNPIPSPESRVLWTWYYE